MFVQGSGEHEVATEKRPSGVVKKRVFSSPESCRPVTTRPMMKKSKVAPALSETHTLGLGGEGGPALCRSLTKIVWPEADTASCVAK
jgi:hypothetical protein